MSSTRHTDNFNPRKTPAQLPWNCPLSRRDASSETELPVPIMTPGVDLSVGGEGDHMRPTTIDQMDNT